MSRVTRAASRAASRAEQLPPTDQENYGASTGSESTSTLKSAKGRRAILGEISVNDATELRDVANDGKRNAKGMEGLQTKGRREKKTANKNNSIPDVCHDLVKSEGKDHSLPLGHFATDPTSRGDQSPRETQGYGNAERAGETRDIATTMQRDNATFQALTEKSVQLTPQRHPAPIPLALSHTPKFDPELHRPIEGAEAEADKMEDNSDIPNDSFVKSISSRTPLRSLIEVDPSKSEDMGNANASDSFVDEIKSRSPTKPNSAPEDPIDALDAFEDEIERITRDMPTVPNEALKSPAPDFSTRPEETLPTVGLKQDAKLSSRPTARSPPKPASRPTKPSRPTSFHAANTSHKTTVRRPLSSSALTSKSTATSSSSSNTKTSAARPSLASGAVTRLSDKRTSISTRKPAFVPTKSSKPPTHPTFALPSSTISARKKAEKEARLKAEQEELQRRRSFKAKPVRVSSVQNSLPVKGTASSQARASLARGEGKMEENENDSPAGRIARVSSVSRGKPLVIAKRPTTTANNATTRQAARSGSSSSSTLGGRSRTSSLPSKPGPVVKSTVTEADRIHQKAKAKEIVGRDKIAKEEIERERREKEESARRARAEAAERGRLASREWAERQREKKEKQRLAGERLNGSGSGIVNRNGNGVRA